MKILLDMYKVNSNKEKYLLMQIINTWTFTPLNLNDRILVWFGVAIF